MSADNLPAIELNPPPAPATAVLIGVSSRVRPHLEGELSTRGFRVIDGDSACPDSVRLVIVEGDRGPGMVATVREIRSRLPRAVVIGITGWWNDLEGVVRREASAVLHVPISERECRSVLHAFEAT